MFYMEEINKALDVIMKTQHRITNSIVNLAEDEIANRPQNPIEESLLELEFEELHKQYQKLKEKMKESKIERVKAELSNSGIGTLTKEDINHILTDENVTEELREEMLEYIKDSYLDMRFIDNYSEKIPSIYSKQKCKNIRELEFAAYREAIVGIENGEYLANADYDSLGYQDVASIIYDLALKRSYEVSYKKANNLLSGLSQNGKLKMIQEKDKKDIRAQLIYMKYEEKFKLLFSRHNNVLTNVDGMKEFVESMEKSQNICMFLGISKKDYNDIYSSIVKEYIEDFKEVARHTFIKNMGNAPKKESKFDRAIKSLKDTSKEQVKKIAQKISKKAVSFGDSYDAR